MPRREPTICGPVGTRRPAALESHDQAMHVCNDRRIQAANCLQQRILAGRVPRPRRGTWGRDVTSGPVAPVVATQNRTKGRANS
jgi:hypothetical protein